MPSKLCDVHIACAVEGRCPGPVQERLCGCTPIPTVASSALSGKGRGHTCVGVDNQHTVVHGVCVTQGNSGAGRSKLGLCRWRAKASICLRMATNSSRVPGGSAAPTCDEDQARRADSHRGWLVQRHLRGRCTASREWYGDLVVALCGACPSKLAQQAAGEVHPARRDSRSSRVS